MAGVVAAKMKEKKLREEEEEAKVSNLSLNFQLSKSGTDFFVLCETWMDGELDGESPLEMSIKLLFHKLPSGLFR